MGRDRERGIVPDRRDERIIFLAEPVKVWRGDPGLMDEFELALDVGIDAHEEKTARLCLSVARGFNIRTPHPERYGAGSILRSGPCRRKVI